MGIVLDRLFSYFQVIDFLQLHHHITTLLQVCDIMWLANIYMRGRKTKRRK